MVGGYELDQTTAKSRPARKRQNRKPSRIAQERRRDLIEATIRDIATNGYDKVTVASLCEEAGFSRGLIGHYFASKDALLLEAAKAVAESLGEAMRVAASEAGQSPIDRLHAIIRASFTPPGFTSDNVAVWVSLAGNARWSAGLADIYQRIWREYRAAIGRLFARAAKERRMEINAAETALAFTQMVEGLWIGWNADPDTVSAAAAEACCHQFVDRAVCRATAAVGKPVR